MSAQEPNTLYATTWDFRRQPWTFRSGGPGSGIFKSTDGGVTWSKPVAVSPLVDIVPLADAGFRVNSFPAADVAPNGDLYVAWSSQLSDSGGLCPTSTNVGCHSAALYSTSTDGGTNWSTPALIFPALDAQNRTAIGYPAPGLSTSDTHRVDTFWPGVAIRPGPSRGRLSNQVAGTSSR